MFKKLSILCMAIFVLGLISGSAFAQSYCQDVLETGNPGGELNVTKTCDTVNPETLNPGDTFAIDIWAADLPETIISSGFEMFYNPAQFSLLNVEVYNDVELPGPWDGTTGLEIVDPYGPGSYAVVVGQLSCVTPDAGDDVIVAKATFQCLANGTGDISVKGIDSFDTTVGCGSGIVYDATMGTNALSVTQGSVSTTTTSVEPTTTTSSIEPTTTTSSIEPTTTTTEPTTTTTEPTTTTTEPTTTTTEPTTTTTSVEPTTTTVEPTTTTTEPTTTTTEPTTTTTVVSAASYQAGLATMILDADVPTCETRTISVDGSSFGTSPLVSGGMLVTLSDPSRVVINTVECYDGELSPAVWDAGSTKISNPDGYPGGYAVAASNLGAGVIPSSNILLCDMEFCGAGAGNCTITIGTIPDFDTWVAQDFTTYDSTIAPATIEVTVTGEPVCGNGAVEGDEQCDGGPCCIPAGEGGECTFVTEGTPCPDDLFCNGEETCDAVGVCQPGTMVDCNDGATCTTGDYCDESIDACVNITNNASCSDGLFCSGDEVCNPGDASADPETGCVSGTPVVCPDNGLFCDGTEYCDEDLNACSSTGNPCPSEARVCIEITDDYECIASTCSIAVEPASATVDVLGTVTFSVVVDGTCYYEPSYTWGISSTAWTGCTGPASGSAIGSTIDATGQYTAGISGGTDYIRVTDIDNGEICDFAEVTVIGPTSTTTTSVRPTTTTSTPTTTTTVGPTTSTTTSIGPTTTTTSIPGVVPSIDLRPDSVFQSRWFFLPRLLRIMGTDTNFVRRQTTVTFQPANAILKFPPVVLDSDTMVMWVIIMPRWLTGEVDSVEVTAITGSESASGELGIELLPFFLEEKQGELE